MERLKLYRSGQVVGELTAEPDAFIREMNGFGLPGGNLFGHAEACCLPCRVIVQA